MQLRLAESELESLLEDEEKKKKQMEQIQTNLSAARVELQPKAESVILVGEFKQHICRQSPSN